MDPRIDISETAVLETLLNELSKPALIEQTKEVDLQAPPSLPWEVGNALSALIKRGRIDEVQAQEALLSLERIPIRLTDVELAPCLKLAARHKIYTYDAYVIECARRYRTPLLSLDKQQCAVARSEGIPILKVGP